MSIDQRSTLNGKAPAAPPRAREAQDGSEAAVQN